MNYNNIFRVLKTEKAYDVEFVCPSCKATCSISDDNCQRCGFGLREYKSLIFSYYIFFNNAIDYYNDGRIINAIVEISKYLAYDEKDIEANKFLIYLFYKDGREEEYKKALDDFELKFNKNSWIMELENNGIESYKIPDKKIINFDIISNEFEILKAEFIENRLSNTSDIIDLIYHFYDIVKYFNYNKTVETKVLNEFFDLYFCKYVSKKEISLEISNGKNYHKLSKDEQQLIRVINNIYNKEYSDGTIITLKPLIKIRSRIVAVEEVLIVSNATEKKQKKEEKQNKKES